MNFCDYIALARRLDIIPNEDDIAEMQLILDFALQQMKAYTNRDLEYIQYTEYYDGCKGMKLYLKNIPIKSLTEEGCGIWIDDQLKTDYEVFSNYLYRDAGWEANNYIKVIYYAGYTTDDEQYNELAWIQREIAATLWKRGGSKNFTIDEYGVANFQIANIDTELEIIFSMLDKYKRLIL